MAIRRRRRVELVDRCRRLPDGRRDALLGAARLGACLAAEVDEHAGDLLGDVVLRQDAQRFERVEDRSRERVVVVVCCCCRKGKDGKRRNTLGTQARHQQYAVDVNGEMAVY